MLSKKKIMQEWRSFVARRDEMTRAYTQQHAPVIDVHCGSTAHESPPPTPTAARAPASLTW